jgi:hypothetical protein
MPTVPTTPRPTTNTFYIAANIIFDLATGEAKQVLMLVNKAEDASTFNSEDAQNNLNFVRQRARGIIWSIDQLSPDPTRVFGGPLFSLEQSPRFIIKGVQYV